jgi:iron complex transport system substrate-binding protein
MKRSSWFLRAGVLIFLLVFVGGCSKSAPLQNETAQEALSHYPLTIEDSYNRTIGIEEEPQRIISLAPNITEVIFLLGKEETLLGRTEYCNYPPSVSKITSVGSLQEPNFERIVELKPDLVIASTHFKEEYIARFENLNIKFMGLYEDEGFEGVYETIQKLGVILDVEDEAGKVIVDMKERVQDVTERVAGRETPSVYYVLGYGKGGDFTAGSDTFISQMIKMAGGRNSADDVRGWIYSLEKIIENDPDILVCSKYYDSKNGIMNTSGYQELTAVKNGKIFEVDNDVIDRQGPRLVEGLEAFARIFHPEAF